MHIHNNINNKNLASECLVLFKMKLNLKFQHGTLSNRESFSLLARETDVIISKNEMVLVRTSNI